MKSHFFDLDTILEFDSKVWVVDKNQPNIPIFKINQSDFKLIQSGIFKNQNNPINFSGHTYWLDDNLMNVLKIKAKNYKCDVSNLAFSMQEFMNKEVIENLDYRINKDLLVNLKNTNDDIYIICSKNNKINYEVVISKIEKQLLENGIKIKNYYFISETFFNRNQDDISHKKIRLLLQHLIGLKTDGDKFTDKKITEYDFVNFYDNEMKSIELAKDCNNLLSLILSNTEKSIRDMIKSNIDLNKKALEVNFVSENKVNRTIKTLIDLKLKNIMTFESFKFK